MTERYIGAEHLKEVIDATDFPNGLIPIKALNTIIDSQTTADVAPIVHAHWIKVQWVKDETYQEGGWWISRCSNCIIPYNEQKRYCPNCGARMDEKENEK